MTNSNKYDILLGNERRTDFLLSKNRVQSKLEELNRFSLMAEMHPFLLEVVMPKGIYKHKPLTKEHRLNLSLASIGKPKSEEHCKNISIAFKGKKWSDETREKMRQRIYKKGDKALNWRGGKRKTKGYIMIFDPRHLYNNGSHYIGEHRLVMEKYLKRKLHPQERVHHINGVKTDNRISNLLLCKNTSEHIKTHLKMQVLVYSLIQEGHVFYDKKQKEFKKRYNV